MSAKNEHGLTPQQEKFAQELVKGVNLAEAYRVAYPKSKNWADSAVWAQSSRLMANSKVSARVKALAQKVEEVFTVDTAKLLRESSRIAFSDVSKIMHEDGRVKLPHELDPDTRAAIASFKIDEYGRIEYKFWDKNNSHERLFKHKALFELDNKQKGHAAAEFLAGLQSNVLGVVKQQPDEDDDE